MFLFNAMDMGWRCIWVIWEIICTWSPRGIGNELNDNEWIDSLIDYPWGLGRKNTTLLSPVCRRRQLKGGRGGAGNHPLLNCHFLKVVIDKGFFLEGCRLYLTTSLRWNKARRLREKKNELCTHWITTYYSN